VTTVVCVPKLLVLLASLTSASMDCDGPCSVQVTRVSVLSCEASRPERATMPAAPATVALAPSARTTMAARRFMR
jgi:hypothetical protein